MLVTQPAKAVLKAVLRRRALAPVLAFVLHRHIARNKLSGDEEKPQKRIIILSYERWSQDVEELLKIKGSCYFTIDDQFVAFLYTLFEQGSIQTGGKSYWTSTNPEELKARDRQARGIARIVFWLFKFGNYDAFLTCGFKYMREIPVATACVRLGIPFIAWHKEFTVLEPHMVQTRIEQAREYRFRFHGTHLACVNQVAKDVFSGSDIADKKKIYPVGLLRADSLIKGRAAISERERRHVVFFSFGHLTGPFPAHPFRNYYFSRNDDFGFVELFRRSHGIFAELSLEYPDVDFLFKPKNFEPGWIDEITMVVEAHIGRPLDNVPNCRIVNEPAQSLMEGSLANICLNSTTVIESRLLKRNTILPVFAEAADKHQTEVCFRSFLDLFTVATSEDGFKQTLHRSLRGESFVQGDEVRLKELLRLQLGNDDGYAAKRLSQLISNAVDQRSSRLGKTVTGF